MKKKIRKPRALKFNGDIWADIRDTDKEYPMFLRFSNMRYLYSLKHFKRLHKWLGKAIEYLEARDGE